jgi:hypothetical protein
MNPGLDEVIQTFLKGLYALTILPFFICTGVPGFNSSSVHNFSYKSAR